MAKTEAAASSDTSNQDKLSAEKRELTRRLGEIEALERPMEILDAIEDGYVAQGVRLAKAGVDEGHTIVFSPEEAKKLNKTLVEIINARRG